MKNGKWPIFFFFFGGGGRTWGEGRAQRKEVDGGGGGGGRQGRGCKDTAGLRRGPPVDRLQRCPLSARGEGRGDSYLFEQGRRCTRTRARARGWLGGKTRREGEFTEAGCLTEKRLSNFN